jgi:hypothetical protein
MTDEQFNLPPLPDHYNGILNAKFYTGAQMIDYARAAVLADRAARAAASAEVERLRALLREARRITALVACGDLNARIDAELQGKK